MDLLRALPLREEALGLAQGLEQRHGDPAVIHHEDLAGVVQGQGLGGLAGAAEARGHREVQDSVVVLQQVVPALRDAAGGGLGGGHLRSRRQARKEEGLGAVLPLPILRPVDEEGHGDQGDPPLRRLLRRDAAVGVRHDRSSHSIALTSQFPVQVQHKRKYLV